MLQECLDAISTGYGSVTLEISQFQIIEINPLERRRVAR